MFVLGCWFLSQSRSRITYRVTTNLEKSGNLTADWKVATLYFKFCVNLCSVLGHSIDLDNSCQLNLGSNLDLVNF